MHATQAKDRKVRKRGITLFHTSIEGRNKGFLKDLWFTSRLSLDDSNKFFFTNDAKPEIDPWINQSISHVRIQPHMLKNI